MSEIENTRSDVLDDVLRLGAGFADGDRRWVLDALESLVPHLARWGSALNIPTSSLGTSTSLGISLTGLRAGFAQPCQVRWRAPDDKTRKA